ncbi:VOC family protein [Streptomyces sp. A7024]|uniref:VOC family protein n=1 Tax=Streptomyces coryli TaxID=1128680 RepID=A0A6G4TZK8_9ACTN|nr:VOC family protein [Streptomyces coryli]NGN64950.1 VOC family protein [Streptomyces coryli]
MLDHLAIQVADPEKSAQFYTTALAPLGIVEAMRFERDGGLVVGLAGPDGAPVFWLGPHTGDQPTTAITRENHIAFTAPNREAVDAVHAAARATGTAILHAPREWPEYHPGYYGVYFRDPDSHNIEAVTHGTA